MRLRLSKLPRRDLAVEQLVELSERASFGLWHHEKDQDVDQSACPDPEEYCI